MIIKFIIVFIAGMMIGIFFMGLMFTAGKGDDISYAYHQGYEKGRREISNEVESEI